VAEIVVVGSLNEDTTLRVPRLPAPGETILGHGLFSDAGGKGANQAVAAARLGRSVAMIGRVGVDAAATRLVGSLEEAGVDTSGVVRSAETGTGAAIITVDEGGENTIVVIPGANANMTPGDVEEFADLLASASLTLLQLEVPLDAVSRAADLSGGTVILNPAPASALPDELLVRSDVLVPNETELALLTNGPIPTSVDQAAALAEGVAGPGAVVVTLGSRGALVVADGDATLVSAPSVEAVDPTGAGDAFCAGLADALVRGTDLVDAARWAVRCGAAAVTRWGAQASLPTAGEVEAVPA
jgi:ribokinase